MDVETLQRLFANASTAEGFERIGSRTAKWDISGSCVDPVQVTLSSRQTGNARFTAKNHSLKYPPGITVYLSTPCRRCEPCLRYKSWLWRSRAAAELEAAPRTWFLTFTASPEQHIRWDHECSTRKRNFWSLPPAKIFAERSQVMGREITKYLKRIRTNTRVPIRYLLVTEAHDSEDTSDFLRGRPHLHMLLHEVDPGLRVTKRLLQSEWPFGHVGCKLADSQAPWYLSKYISKACDARVRASLKYGYGVEDP